MSIKSFLLSAVLLGTFSTMEDENNKLFVKWNTVTLASIEASKGRSRSGSERFLLQDAGEAMVMFWEIEDTIVNANSIRWQFLETARKEGVYEVRDWKVVEELRPGYVMKYFNYLFIGTGEHEYRVIKYRYLDGNWHQIGEKKMVINKSTFDSDPRKPYATVISSHKTIVSQFSLKDVKNSEFYLQTTFSDKSELAEILNSQF